MSALPARPSFSQLQKQAKRLHKNCQSGVDEALAQLRQHHARYADADRATCAQLSLREAQYCIARQYGEDSWNALKEKVQNESKKSSREEIRSERIQQQTSTPAEIERIIRAASGSNV